MKLHKLLTFAAIAMFAVGMSSCSSSKISASAKNAAKIAEARGFRPSTFTFTTEELISQQQKKLAENPNLIELTQTYTAATEFGAEMAVQNGVAIKYAQSTLSVIEGEMNRSLGKTDKDNSWDAFAGEYTQTLSKFIISDLQVGYKLVKNEPNGVTVMIAYLLDESKAAAKRAEAAAAGISKGNFSSDKIKAINEAAKVPMRNIKL